MQDIYGSTIHKIKYLEKKVDKKFEEIESKLDINDKKIEGS